MSVVTTPHRANRYPSLDRVDAPDIPLWMSRLALDLDDAPKHGQGTLAARPGAGSYSGHYYYCTDTRLMTVWDGSAWHNVGASTGDLKHCLQTADHDGWIFCDGRNSILRSAASTSFVNLMLALGYTGSDGTHIGVPDYRGRTLVGLGTNGDVNALTDSDGLAVASRTPKHGHTEALSADATAPAITAAVNGPGNLLGPPGSGNPAASFHGVTDVNVPSDSGVPAILEQMTKAVVVSNTVHGHSVSGSIGVGTANNTPAFGVGAIFVHI